MHLVAFSFFSLFIFLFFFFFQAEDGIRDDLVTGVQTCALPICRRARRTATRTLPVTDGRAANSPAGSNGRYRDRWSSRRCRSEERRVGKECRTRWATYH